MLYRYLIFFFLACCVQAAAFGQKQKVIDSLIALLPAMKEDTNKVNLYSRISSKYYNFNSEEGIKYGEQELALAKKIDFKRGIARAYNVLAVIYSDAGDHSRSLEYYHKALKMAEESGDRQSAAAIANNIAATYTDQGNFTKALTYYNTVLQTFEITGNKSGIAIVNGNIANIYARQSNYPKALEHYHRALKIREEMGDRKGVAFNTYGIGKLYMSNNSEAKALEFFLKSLKIYEEIEDKHGAANSMGSIGMVYGEQKNYPVATTYYLKALEIYEQLGLKKNVAAMAGTIGNSYRKQKKYTDALAYFSKALQIQEAINDKSGIAATMGRIGITYRVMATDSTENPEQGNDTTNKKKLLTSAIEYLQKSVAIYKEIGELNSYQDFSFSLSQAYELNNDYINAYNTYKEHILYKDSIFNDGKKNEIARLEIQYEFSRKEDSLKYINELSGSRLQQQILLSQQQQQALLLTNKEKDLQHLHFLKTQAELQFEKEAKKKQQSLSEKEKQLHKASLVSLEKDNTLNKLKLRQQWLYSIAGLLLLAGTGGFFFYRNRVQQAKLKTELAREKAEQERTAAEFQRKMSDAALSSLRSQMNPHFIFNCLNSIRLYAAKNDSVAATGYLSKFSRLMRLVLENSKSERITLQQELESLRLYMDMEAMRFKDKLHYEIVVDSNIDLGYIEIPPMLIQPYIENAIWHGLMHKEEGGRIDIYLSEKDEVLIASIRDNGVGRIKAAELKSKSAVAHKSFGMNITNERLELINQKYNIATSVIINDLYSNGTPAGTEVIISIPV